MSRAQAKKPGTLVPLRALAGQAGPRAGAQAARPTAPRTGRRAAAVVNLSSALQARRLGRYRERVERVLRTNKRTIGKLYVTGGLFTRAGARAGRDLLVAHEHLLRVVRLLDRLVDEGDVPAPKSAAAVDAVFRELDGLLEQTDALTRHSAELLGELKP